MKSEERHALKRNDLDSGISDLPGLWARHGNKVLIVLTVALLIFAALRYRDSQALQRDADARQALANAWSGVEQFSRLSEGPASAEIDKMRTSLKTEVNQAVQIVIDSSPNATQAAWAHLARGEMYWAFARGNSASPTTAPSSQPAGQPPENPLALASTAYSQVINEYGSVMEAAMIARFSLATIAEETGKLADARTQYKAIIETKDVPPTHKSMATARLTRLDNLEKPTLLLPASQPAVAPGSDLMQSLSPLRSLGGAMMPPAPATTTPATQPAR